MEIKELTALVEERSNLKNELNRIKTELVGPINSRIDEIDGALIAQLDEMEVNSFKTKYGTITKTARTSYRTPKTAEDKAAFFEWLKNTRGEDVYMEKIGINSQTLNAIAKEEFEAAIEEGNIDFSIPGLEEPSIRETISFRR